MAFQFKGIDGSVLILERPNLWWCYLAHSRCKKSDLHRKHIT